MPRQSRRRPAAAGRQFLWSDARRSEIQALADRVLGTLSGEELPRPPAGRFLATTTTTTRPATSRSSSATRHRSTAKPAGRCPGNSTAWTIPQVTFLMIDTNWKPISGGGQGNRKPCLSDEEKAAQQAWLEKQLASPRAPFTVVCGHHPVYSDAKHGDTPPLVAGARPHARKSRRPPLPLRPRPRSPTPRTRRPADLLRHLRRRRCQPLSA